MGTRNMTCAVIDKKMVLAQYCQWDGYPEGQGRTVIDFIRENQNNMDVVRARFRALEPITDEEIEQRWKEHGAEDEFVDLDTSKSFEEAYPHLHRNCGAKVLGMIARGAIKDNRVTNNPSFAADSLFCEYCYVLDFDREVLEVYTGFVKEPHEAGRFAKLELLEPGGTGTQYYPIKLVCEYPFEDIYEYEHTDQLVTELCFRTALERGYTREVEYWRMWAGASGDSGTWDTAYIEIPDRYSEDSPRKELNDAVKLAAQFVEWRDGEAPVEVGLYSIPGVDECEEEVAEAAN